MRIRAEILHYYGIPVLNTELQVHYLYEIEVATSISMK